MLHHDNHMKDLLAAFITLFLLHVRIPEDAQFAFSLGNLMHLCSDKIASLIQAATASEIQIYASKKTKKLKEILHIWDGRDLDVDMRKVSKALKEIQSQSDVEQVALRYLRLATGRTPDQLYIHMMNAKVCLSNKDYEFAIYWFVKSISISSSLYTTALSLRYLAKICYRTGHYVLALRLLRTVCKCCHLYERTIMPWFVNKYRGKRKRIRKKIQEMRCCHCNKKGGKLMCCTACMKTAYCSKSCQKRDWKLNHRDECDGSWLVHYKHLRKRSVFDL